MENKISLEVEKAHIYPLQFKLENNEGKVLAQYRFGLPQRTERRRPSLTFNQGFLYANVQHGKFGSELVAGMMEVFKAIATHARTPVIHTDVTQNPAIIRQAVRNGYRETMEGDESKLTRVFKPARATVPAQYAEIVRKMEPFLRQPE